MWKRTGIKALLPPGISISGIKTIFMCFCDSKGKTVLAECADDLFRNILKICWKIYSRKNVWIAYLRNIAIKYILRNIEHSIRGWSCWYWCNIYIDIGYRYTERQIDGVPMPDIWETMCEWQVGLVWHGNPLNPDPRRTDCSTTPSLLLSISRI